MSSVIHHGSNNTFEHYCHKISGEIINADGSRLRDFISAVHFLLLPGGPKDAAGRLKLVLY